MAARGAAAILIEDKVTPRALTADGKPGLLREKARIKVRAAVAAAKESGILVMARTDCQHPNPPGANVDMILHWSVGPLFPSAYT